MLDNTDKITDDSYRESQFGNTKQPLPRYSGNTEGTAATATFEEENNV